MSVGSVGWGYCHNIPRTPLQQEQKYLSDLAQKLNGGDPADPVEAAKGFASVRQFLQDTQQVGQPSQSGAVPAVQGAAQVNAPDGSTPAPTRLDMTV